MPKHLPEKVCVAPDKWLPIIEKEMEGGLGCCDFWEEVIYIDQKQHPIGKHSILLHEMIHIATEKIKASGLVKRQPSESFVANLAGTLFLMLALSGLWNGVTQEEVQDFLKDVEHGE